MSIPKGLIFYKAARHRENFPVDRKYGYYSDKISPSLRSTTKKPYAKFHRRYQKKLVQEISFSFFSDIPTEIEAIRVFSRFSGIRRCTIDSSLFSLDNKAKKLMIEILQKLFRSLKRIKQLKLNSLGPLDKDPKTLKNLLLLNQLESLMLISLGYSDNSTNLRLFLKVFQEAFKRRSWPNFKSLRILPFWPDGPVGNRLPQYFQNLLEFLQGLKSCENIYKCSSFRVNLPNCSRINSKQAEILSKIAKTAPSLTKIRAFHLEHFSKFFKMCQNSKNLKGVRFKILDHQHEQNIDLSPLEKASTLEELELRMENTKGGLCRSILPQIEALTNLTVLSLDFCGKPAMTDDLKRDLVKTISKLSELKDFKLKFRNIGEKGDLRYAQFHRVWFGDVFEEISFKKKLEKLSLYFWSFDFENSSKLFEVLCQSLEKLTQLTDLELEIMNGGTIEEKEILLFCEALKKLNKIQHFGLKIQKSLSFKPHILNMLADCIAESFPFLRDLALVLSDVEITRQSFLSFRNAIKKMRCLDGVTIMLDGRAEKGVCVKLLVDEVRKRTSGNVYASLIVLDS